MMNEPYLRTITSKLQLTLPIALCRRLGLKRGDKLAFTVKGGRAYGTPLRSLGEKRVGTLSAVTPKEKGSRR